MLERPNPQTRATCQHTWTVLPQGFRGHKVSPKKAQITSQWVQGLGYLLTPTARALAPQRKQAMLALRVPRSKRQLRGFLGIASFCCLWIPGFGLIAEPPYEALKGDDKEPIDWTPECQSRKAIYPTHRRETRHSTWSPYPEIRSDPKASSLLFKTTRPVAAG